jgi:hypothetical protein
VNVFRIVIAVLTIVFVLVSALSYLDAHRAFVAVLAAADGLFALVSVSYERESEHDPILAVPFHASLATRAPPVL